MAAKTRRPSKSAEQRQAEAKALHDTLTAQVEQLAESGEWMRYLEFLKSFHHYSLPNVPLILAQQPSATLVAGFRQWQAKGRQVRKGEQSIKIRGYSTKRITETDTETGDETARQLRGSRSCPCSTSPKPTPSKAPTAPNIATRAARRRPRRNLHPHRHT